MPDFDKRIVNVDTDDSQSSEVARALWFSGEMVSYAFEGGDPCPWSPGHEDAESAARLTRVEPLRWLAAEACGESSDDQGIFDDGPMRLCVHGATRVFPCPTSDAVPLIPTPEAVERWGEWWWQSVGGRLDVVYVSIGLEVTGAGSDIATQVREESGWLGPVLERPVTP